MAERVAGSPEGGLKVSSSSVQDVRFGPFRFDVANGFLYRDGIALPLPPRALGVLAVLATHPGQVVTKQAAARPGVEGHQRHRHLAGRSREPVAPGARRRAAARRLHPDDSAARVSLRRAAGIARMPATADQVPDLAAVPAEDGVVDAVAALGAGGAWRHPADLGCLESAPTRDAANGDDRALQHRAARRTFTSPTTAPRWPLRQTRRRLRLWHRAPASLRCCSSAVWPTPPPVRWPAPKRPRRRFSRPTDAPSATSRTASCGDSTSTAACRAPSRPPCRRPEAVWTRDDVIVYGARWGEGLLRVPATGGEPRLVTRIDRAAGEGRHAWPDRRCRDGPAHVHERAAERPACRAAPCTPGRRRRAGMSTLVEHASFPRLLPFNQLLAWRQSAAGDGGRSTRG